MGHRHHRHAAIWGILAITAAVVILGASCSIIPMKTTIPIKEYYIINYTPIPTIPEYSQRPYPVSLMIGRFEVQRIFNRQNILYRFSPNRIQYYELDRWAVRPEEMVQDMVLKHIESAGLVNRLGTEFLDNRPDYRLDGTVDAIEKYDAGDLFFAHLAMSFKLYRTDDGVQVWDYSFDQRRQVYSREMVKTVEGMSGLMQTHMNVITAQLDSLFLDITSGVSAPTTLTRPDSGPSSPEPAPSSGDGVDESGYEIIPETR